MCVSDLCLHTHTPSTHFYRTTVVFTVPVSDGVALVETPVTHALTLTRLEEAMRCGNLTEYSSMGYSAGTGRVPHGYIALAPNAPRGGDAARRQKQTHMHAHACAHARTRTRTHTHTHARRHARTHTHPHASIHTHRHTTTHARTHAHQTHAHTHTHTQCTQTHTPTHTHMRPKPRGPMRAICATVCLSSPRPPSAARQRCCSALFVALQHWLQRIIALLQRIVCSAATLVAAHYSAVAAHCL